MNTRFRQDVLVFVGLVAVGVATRLAPYYTGLETWNMTATAGAALFAGFYFADLRIALLVPLLAMIMSDLLIGGYDGLMMAANYAGMSIAVLPGALARKGRWRLAVIPAALVASLAFFAVSNLGVWFCWYPRTWQGLLTCYANAIPFFRGTLAGDLLFSIAFFGVYDLAIDSGWILAVQPQADLEPAR